MGKDNNRLGGNRVHQGKEVCCTEKQDHHRGRSFALLITPESPDPIPRQHCFIQSPKPISSLTLIRPCFYLIMEVEERAGSLRLSGWDQLRPSCSGLPHSGKQDLQSTPGLLQGEQACNSPQHCRMPGSGQIKI